MSLACLALSLHAEGGVIAGEGNCPRSDNKSLFIGMQPGIPAKPWKWDECGASQEGEEGHQNSPSSSAWYPARGAQPAWDPPPPPPLQEVILYQKAGSFCIQEQMAPCPKVGQSRVLQGRHKCLSELPQVASILPLPPVGTRSGVLRCCRVPF